MILVRDLLKHGSVKTTHAKAKAVAPIVEKLITKAKDGSSASLSRMRQVLADETMVKSLLEMAKTRFHTRTSGYTRVIRLGLRRGDAAEAALLEFVDAAPVKTEVKKAEKTAVKKEDKKVQEAEVVEEKPKRREAKTKKASK